MHHLSYFHAIVIGLLQGVTELFPVSSLGHGVILPALFGWNDLVRPQSAVRELLPRVPRRAARRHRRRPARLLLARLDADHRRVLHDAAHAARDDARRAVRLAHHLRDDPGRDRGAHLRAPAPGALRQAPRRVDLPHDQRRDPALRRARPAPHARDRRSARRAQAATSRSATTEAGGFRHLDTLSYPRGTAIGATQILALFAGISRSGVTMVAGLVEGLDHEDAARFSFMLATPGDPARGPAQAARPQRRRWATACATRRSWPRSARGWPRGPRCASWCGGSRRGRCGRSGSTASSRAPPAPSTSVGPSTASAPSECRRPRRGAAR